MLRLAWSAYGFKWNWKSSKTQTEHFRIDSAELSFILGGIAKHKTKLKSSYREFFSKLEFWAGSSAWYERRIRNAEVAGSNPARSTEPRACRLDFRAGNDLVRHLFHANVVPGEVSLNLYCRFIKLLSSRIDSLLVK